MTTGITPTPPEGPIKRIINGPVLDAAHYGTKVRNWDPSLHRLQNAFGLTIGLFMGRQTMNLLVGETPSGEKIDIKEVPLPLKPLHGILAYNHFSDDPKDRWHKVVDLWTPAVMGGAGAIAGTYNFAMTEVPGLHPYTIAQEFKKNPKAATLEKAEVASLFTQSHPWRMLSGITSMFGSASGFQLMPGLNNYGATLGSSFAMSTGRNKFATPYAPLLGEFMTGNKHHAYPFGPASMLGQFNNYLLHNPDKNPKQARAMAYAIMEPWFGNQVTKEHIDKFVGEVTAARNKFFKEGGVPEKLKADCKKEIDALITGQGLEKTFKKIGLNPETASIGRNGFWERMARYMGSGSKLDNIEKQYKEGVVKRLGGEAVLGEVARARTHPGDGRVQLLGSAVVAMGAVAVGAMATQARRWHQSDNDELLQCKKEDALEEIRKKNGGVLPPNAEESLPEELLDIAVKGKTLHSGRSIGEVMNDKPLKFMEWMGDAFNSPETVGLHRLACALGLTGGGVVGLKLTEALTGRNFTGGVVPIEKIPEMLRPLYKKMAYNPFSDHPKDRWGYVMHLAIPAVFATSGVIGASSTFFNKRRQEVKKAEFIDEYENKMTMQEAGPWTMLTATSTILNTPSGSIFLPLPGINYGMSLGTRFTMSSGRKMIFPGVGEWWTGNASRYPLGPAALRDYMIKYAVNNPSQHPDQLEEMVIGVLKPWFKNITGDQIIDFVQKIEADRDKFLKEGGVPEESKKELEKLLISHLKGAGLEQTLREVGLDPAEAHLGNNGFSGKIAEWLGAGTRMHEIQQEFLEKYRARSAGTTVAPVPGRPLIAAREEDMTGLESLSHTERLARETPSSDHHLAV